MKRRIFSLIMALLLLSTTAFATVTRASDYLSSYGGVLGAMGDGEMNLSYSVYATGKMDVVGAMEIEVEQKVGSNWYPYMTYSVDDYPEFYSYNKYSHSADFSFTGIPGVTYRVILTAYAEKDGGSDTGTVTISEETCI